MLVDCADGRELATTVYPYANGVIDERLPEPHAHVELEPDWALQDPQDYLRALEHTVPAVLAEAHVDPGEVIGIGIDFTALHDAADDRRRHAALPARRPARRAARVGQALEAPRRAAGGRPHQRRRGRARRAVADALRRQDLVGVVLREDAPDPRRGARGLRARRPPASRPPTGSSGSSPVSRPATTAPPATRRCGRSATASRRDDYFAALDPRLEHVVDEKLSRAIAPIGTRAGVLTERAAALTGLRPGTPVAVANVDAHVSAPAATVTQPGTMVVIMGTSNCHIVLGDQLALVEGMCGVVEDGVVPGLFGYEAGQSGVGDIFAWFADHAVPPEYHDEARRRGTDVHAVLEQEAAALRPGESGLLALDWWNGNRSVLVDAELSGLLVGMTLATRAPEIYRALIEATAFGTRVIVDAFESAGVPVDAHRRLRRAPAAQRAADADLRRRHRPRASRSPPRRRRPRSARRCSPPSPPGPERGGYASIVDASQRMAHLAPSVVPAGRRAPRPLLGALPRVRPPARPVRTRRGECDEGPATDPRRIRKDGGYRVSARALTRHRRPDDHEGAMGLDEADTTFSASR